MEYAVSHHHELLAHGQTDNAYQVRNVLAQYLENDPFDYEDDHTILTKSGLNIKCTAKISPLLKSTPTVEENLTVILTQPKPVVQVRLPKQPDPNLIILQTICEEIGLRPIVARRILRKHFGAKNLRYEWPKSDVHAIKNLLKNR